MRSDSLSHFYTGSPENKHPVTPVFPVQLVLRVELFFKIDGTERERERHLKTGDGRKERKCLLDITSAARTSWPVSKLI